MRHLEFRRQWFTRLVVPGIWFVGLSAAWAGWAVALLQRWLGITISVNGRPLGFVELISWYMIESGLGVVALNGVAIGALAAVRRRPRWWLLLVMLVVVGTPVGLVAGRAIAQYAWSQNSTVREWEAILAPPIGLAATWLVLVLVEWGLDALEGRALRARAARGLCVGCGYDLRAQLELGQGTCPECGLAIAELSPTRRERP